MNNKIFSLRHKLIIFLFFALINVLWNFELHAQSPLPVDMYQSMEVGNSGDSLSAINLNSSAFPAGGTKWSYIGSSGNMNVSDLKALPLRGPISIAGTTIQADNGTQRSWAVDDNKNMQYVAANIGSRTKVTVAGYLTIGPATGNSNNIFDAIVIGDYPFAVCQIWDGPQGGSNKQYLEIESAKDAGGYQTLHSSLYFRVTPGVPYWISLQYDGSAGTAQLAVYDPTTWTIIPAYNSSTWAQAPAGSIASMSGLFTGSFNNIKFGRADTHPNGTPNSITYFDNILIDYSNAAFPLLPPATGTPIVPKSPSNLRVGSP